MVITALCLKMHREGPRAAVFAAPWGPAVTGVTGVAGFILAAICAIGLFSGPDNNMIWIAGMVVIPLTMLIVAALFSIRSYQLSADKLVVRRLGWTSDVDLAGLQSAEVDAEAMKQSVRLFANGGLFCFCGKFDNARFGTYSAFATDPRRSVVLTFVDRKVVVTPDRPDVFVAEIRNLINT